MNTALDKLKLNCTYSCRFALAGMMLFTASICSAETPSPTEAASSAETVLPNGLAAEETQPLYKQYFQWLEFTTQIASIGEVLKAHKHPYLTVQDFSFQQEALDKLYQLSEGRLLWVDGQIMTERGLVAIELLKNAASAGLNAGDYDIKMLQEKQLRPGQQVSIEQAALYDSALNIALLRFLSDLHSGRINPEILKIKFKAKEHRPDFAQLLFDAAQQGNVSKLPAKVEPDLVLYRNLKALLPQYRELARQQVFTQFDFGKKLTPGQSHPQIPQLRQLLQLLSDLTADKNNPAEAQSITYRGAIVEAMKKFQTRHGLDGDGTIGAKTMAMLNTPLQQRVQQIELTMERLRWLPELTDSPYIVVNIPSYRLWAFDAPNPEGKYALTMKVVVGEALDKQTPVFMADMRYLDFNPYWNVPYSIMKNEILPKLLTDPGYLSKQNMEVVNRSERGVKAVALSGDSFKMLRSGDLQIRQRPGKKNALGSVKFVFPNENGVYMHDTPSQQYFARTRRDFSHGCIRVSEPEMLAEFALKFQEGWDKEKVHAAMVAESSPQHVKLKQPIPVIIFYATALVGNDGEAYFMEDIYGQDNHLNLALAKKPSVPNAKKPSALDPQLAAGTPYREL